MEKLNLSYLGAVLKQARLSAKMTQEDLAECIGVTSRYIMAIENEGKIPSSDNLLKLIRTLNISADVIIYPEKSIIDTEDEQLIRTLLLLNKRDKKIIMAMVQAMINNKD